MSQVPPTNPPLSPYITVDDGHAAVEFYQRAFGATVIRKQATPDGKKLIHASLNINGGVLMLSDDFPEMRGGVANTPKAFGGSPVTLHLDLEDVDAVFAQALAAGATVTMELADQFWGDRYGSIKDPFGHHWSLATRKKEVSQEDLDAATKEQFSK